VNYVKKPIAAFIKHPKYWENRMIGLLRKFFALSADDKKQVLLAALWLPLMHFRLNWFGLQSCLGSMEMLDADVAQQEVFDAARYEQACVCERYVALASRHGLLAGTCLSRSLTVMQLLSHRRIAARLRVGVNVDAGMLDAHAWVEVAGTPLGQGEIKYETFPLL
jgi:hypothetical protein